MEVTLTVEAPDSTYSEIRATADTYPEGTSTPTSALLRASGIESGLGDVPDAEHASMHE